MEDWLKDRRPKLDGEPKNGEEMSLSRVGKDLYEKVKKIFFFNGPTLVSFSFYFWSFQSNITIFATNQCEKCHVHPAALGFEPMTS